MEKEEKLKMATRLAKARMIATLQMNSSRGQDDDLDMPEYEDEKLEVKESKLATQGTELPKDENNTLI